MIKLVDKLRYLLLKIVLPKQQFYIQNNKFHSVFHPLMRPMLDGSLEIEDYLDESDESDNSQ